MSNLLNGCVNMGLGTRDVEHFMFKQEGLHFRRDGGGKGMLRSSETRRVSSVSNFDFFYICIRLKYEG